MRLQKKYKVQLTRSVISACITPIVEDQTSQIHLSGIIVHIPPTHPCSKKDLRSHRLSKQPLVGTRLLGIELLARTLLL